MEKIEKYRSFLVNLIETHPDKAFFESVLSAYNILFESDEGIETVDTPQADQLSTITKQIKNIDKAEQDAIYKKFIEIDPKKIYPRQTISMIFGKLKNMIAELMERNIGVERIMEYLDQYA